MKSIPYDRRRNTLSSDMAAYMRAVASDNDEAVSRLKRNLRVLKSYTDYEEDLYEEAV